jgi:hypothetical protein
LLLTLTLCTSSGLAQLVYSYDTVATAWVKLLRTIPANQRVLVLANGPVPAPGLDAALAPLTQRFDPNQFSSVYALERGGFVSNTFFNGPLLPHPELTIPPYWWAEFVATEYLRTECALLRSQYGTLIIWGAASADLNHTAAACYQQALVDATDADGLP